MGNYIKELFVAVIGFEGYYEISNTGKLKSVERYAPVGGGGRRLIKEKILRTGVSIWGYRIARLCKNKKHFYTSIHRLVAIAFIPNTNNKPEVNHINGIKTDNRAENLEWMTSSENQKHAVRTGLQVPIKGEHNKASKLTGKEVLQIKTHLKSKAKSQYRLAKDFGVHKMTINDIYQNKTWKHIEI